MFLRLVHDHAEEMDKLVQSLLQFLRLSRRPLQKQNVQPVELVNAVLDDLRAQQGDRDVQIQIGDLPECWADPILLKQVFANLLSNAFKYTRPRERACIEIGVKPEIPVKIQVSGSRPDGPELETVNLELGTAYYVSFNGVGFDMAQAGQLFGVFQRLHAEGEYEGTSVGLAIVQRIVHRHGGRVWAEAQVDRRATFYFTLG